MKRETLIWLAVFGLLLAGTGTAVFKMTRGLRNNNPGNIRKSADKWQGLSAEQPDPEFFSFQTPEYGIRAMAKILKNYQVRHGINTIRGIINRWAPPVENDTGAYIEHVARVVGVNPDQPINVNDILRPLVEVIIKHENGVQPYSPETISNGLRLA